MRKLLIGGIVVGTALLAPSVAGAQAIPGGIYTGAFTTGTGGTVSLEVDGNGTTVDVDADDFGQTGCEGSSASRDDIPLSADSFNLLDPGPPALVSLTGFFESPGTVTGTARLSFGCDSGTQSWTAETDVTWADGLIARAGNDDPRGDDVYNTSAAQQTRKWTAKPGQTRKFEIPFQNDGTFGGAILGKGCKSSKGFKVKYTERDGDGPEDITRGMFRGTYGNFVAEGDTLDLELAIKVTRKAKPGKTKVCKIESTGDDDQTDVVAAELKAKRR
jgi:hypothetical protein